MLCSCCLIILLIIIGFSIYMYLLKSVASLLHLFAVFDGQTQKSIEGGAEYFVPK